MKKIGILTLPLWNNYGGILQTYALNYKLKSLGYETLVIDYQKSPQSKVEIAKIHSKNLMKKYLFKHKTWNLSQTDSFRSYISSNTRGFVESELTPLSSPVFGKDELSKMNDVLDGVIVGSDQVWRPDYAPNWGTYFLDFLDSSKLKISYSASFGKENVKFTEAQLMVARKELCKFDAISVREMNGLDIIKENFGFKAEHILDPTLLLDREDYESIVDKYKEQKSCGNLFTYILDHNETSEIIINKVSEEMNLNSFEVNSKIPKVDIDLKTIDDHVYPRVTKWLKAFVDAEYVIADSFHGCVFSIIFNKPFIAVGNQQRGLTRFTSLLETFDLTSRLVLEPSQITEELINYEFDWDKINKIRNFKRKESIDFLTNAIGEQNERY